MVLLLEAIDLLVVDSDRRAVAVVRGAEGL
jgi:hypothetical protein